MQITTGIPSFAVPSRSCRLLLCLMTALVAACQPVPRPSPVPTSFVYASREWGEDVAADMTSRYRDTRRSCSGQLALRCSGILFRATSNPANTHAWDPSPESLTNGGVSFSFLRQDATFRALASQYDHGLIFFAYDDAPESRTSPQPLCVFPIDAGTTGRLPPGGCGQQTAFVVPAPAKSAPCQRQGITTGIAWVAHFNALGGSGDVKREGTCGFSLDGSDASSAFMASIDAMPSIASWLDTLTNEVRIKVWNSGMGKQLPIEAFFYTRSSGLALARRDQKDYSDVTTIKRPIIRLTLPTRNAEARFEFVTSDQAIIGDGPPIFDARPPVLEATGNDGRLLRLSDFYSREYVTVNVPRYSNMAYGDRVQVRWQGFATYVTPQKTVATPGDLHFSIPRMEVVDSIGGKVGITFTVIKGTTQTTSANFGLTIANQTLALPYPTFSAAARRVTVAYPAMAAGHLVEVRITGATNRYTGEKRATGSTALTFDLPAEWVAENRGLPWSINYTVRPGSAESRQFSRYLRLPASPGYRIEPTGHMSG